MTVEERVQAVQDLGFLPRQARFLMTVALDSGYCLRRHYMTFTGTQNGKNVQRFLEGLVTRRLAVRLTYRPDRGHVYHLHHWSLYRALGHEENRNRRHVAAALIARKLMLLDVVLSTPDAEWIATEADKVALFTERFHVALEDLPRRTFVSRGANPRTTRYFIHKLPIALVGDPPVVHLVYLAADGGTVSFEWFLREHARLLSALPAWVIVVAHPSRVCATPVWDAVFRRFVSEDSAVTGARVSDLERYFVARRLVISVMSTVTPSMTTRRPIRRHRRMSSASTKRTCGSMSWRTCAAWSSRRITRQTGTIFPLTTAATTSRGPT
jgi:hypothetical protein